ncbi:MAG: DUF484 family protein [Acidiferrobacterales bacterium]
MAIEEQQSELSWEEAVGRFLQENPTYFERYPQLLQQMEIPHPETGRAVSLIERQVAALRRENETLEAQLHQLVENATENDALAGQLHRFIVELMLVGDIEQLVQLATEGLKSRFDLEYAVFKLFSENPDQGGTIYIAENHPLARLISDQVREGQSVCGVQFSPDEINLLFGQDEAPEGSLALIPVQSDRLVGLLVIGSSDPRRFGRDMATTYLDRIGELIAVTAMRLASSRPGQTGK